MREAILGPPPNSALSLLFNSPKAAGGFVCERRTLPGMEMEWSELSSSSSFPLLDAALALAWKRERREKADFLCLTLARFSPPKNPFLFSHPAPDSRTERGGGGGGGMAVLPDIDTKVTAAAADCRQTFLGSVQRERACNASWRGNCVHVPFTNYILFFFRKRHVF